MKKWLPLLAAGGIAVWYFFLRKKPSGAKPSGLPNDVPYGSTFSKPTNGARATAQQPKDTPSQLLNGIGNALKGASSLLGAIGGGGGGAGSGAGAKFSLNDLFPEKGDKSSKGPKSNSAELSDFTTLQNKRHAESPSGADTAENTNPLNNFDTASEMSDAPWDYSFGVEPSHNWSGNAPWNTPSSSSWANPNPSFSDYNIYQSPSYNDFFGSPSFSNYSAPNNDNWVYTPSYYSTPTYSDPFNNSSWRDVQTQSNADLSQSFSNTFDSYSAWNSDPGFPGYYDFNGAGDFYSNYA